MKTIHYSTIVKAIEDLCIKVAHELPRDIQQALSTAITTETAPLAKEILSACIENADIAASEMYPLCQDTGFAVFFVELGTDITITGGQLMDAIIQGTRQGYTKGYLRGSIVSDPLFDRKNSTDNTPPVIHLTLVPGNSLSITCAPKGGGSENMSAIAMLKPSDGQQGVIRFVTDTVCKAGGNPCPPVVVGVGIGGTFEKAAYLSKHALLRDVGAKNSDPRYAQLEETILNEINKTGIGPQGLGGSTTALAVHIETFPCHIASLPVAVNMGCHVHRHASVIL